MRSLTQFLLIVILLSPAKALFAQEVVNKGDVTIHVRITPIAIYGTTLIDIYKRSDKVKIVYARHDSTRFSEVREDTAYINASKNRNYSDSSQTAKLRKILKRYYVYDTTKVTIDLKKDTAYNKILQLMAQTSKKELETSKVGQRFVLDGFGFGSTIVTDKGTKTIGVRTPMPDSHPIIYSFLEETRSRLKSRLRH